METRMPASPARQRLFDGLAISASLLCLAHCLLLPLAILLVPMLAAFLTLPEAFHAWVFALAVPTSLVALLAGWRRHGARQPALLAGAGLLLLGAGLVLAPAHAVETALTVAGSLLLALGHVRNWRLLGARGRMAGNHHLH
jgi:hypothetical protein